MELVVVIAIIGILAGMAFLCAKTTARCGFALGLLLIVLAAKGLIGFWGYIGVVPLLTGVVGNCPAYTLFGVSTCSHNER